MATKFKLEYKLSSGKRHTDPCIPFLQELGSAKSASKMLVRDHSGEVKEFDFSALGLAANIPLLNLGSVTDIDMALPAAYLKNLSEPGSTTYNFINMQQSKSLVVYLLFTYTGPDGYAHNLFFPQVKWAHGSYGSFLVGEGQVCLVRLQSFGPNLVVAKRYVFDA